MPHTKRSKQSSQVCSRQKQPPLALAQAIFKVVGLTENNSGVLKEEALSAWDKLQAMKEIALKSFPRYVTRGFFCDGKAQNIRTTMTFLRRIAQYVGWVVARKKFHKRIDGRLKTYYRYRLLS